MKNKINNDTSITHEYNVLSNILNIIKRTKSKNSYYSPILQGCMNTRSGREKLGFFSNPIGHQKQFNNCDG